MASQFDKVKKMNEVFLKTRVFSGEDSLSRLGVLKNKKVWVISDAFLVDNGTINQVTGNINASCTVEVCKDVIPDPPLENVASGVAKLHDVQPDVVIGFGGGSAIDTAKGIIYFAQFSGYKKPVTFIAIPTTAGTGSEVTSVTVITDKQLETKHLIASHDMLPDEVILCPSLTASVPPAITANTGLDVLTHVVEAYVSKNPTAYSDALAEKGTEMVFQYLGQCYHDGSNLDARGKMQEASNIAGSAFNIAGLGMNHAIAHQLGGTFHIPHGLANALILSEVIRKNAQDAYMCNRYATLACKLGFVAAGTPDKQAVQVFCDKIEALKREMRMPLKITDCKVSAIEFRAKLPEICSNALKDGCVESARKVFTVPEIEQVLLNVL